MKRKKPIVPMVLSVHQIVYPEIGNLQTLHLSPNVIKDVRKEVTLQWVEQAPLKIGECAVVKEGRGRYILVTNWKLKDPVAGEK